MAEFQYADAVRDFSATTGTGTLSLLATASTGYRTFAAGIVAGALTTGATVGYRILDLASGVWETGIGVLTSGSPCTLSRVSVLASSSGNTLINFAAGTRQVDLVILAQGVFGVSKVKLSLASYSDGTGADVTFSTGITVANVPLAAGMRRIICSGNLQLFNSGTYNIARGLISLRNAADTADVVTAFAGSFCGIGNAFAGGGLTGAFELAAPTVNAQILRLRVSKDANVGAFYVREMALSVMAIGE